MSGDDEVAAASLSIERSGWNNINADETIIGMSALHLMFEQLSGYINYAVNGRKYRMRMPKLEPETVSQLRETISYMTKAGLRDDVILRSDYYSQDLKDFYNELAQ